MAVLRQVSSRGFCLRRRAGRLHRFDVGQQRGQFIVAHLDLGHDGRKALDDVRVRVADGAASGRPRRRATVLPSARVSGLPYRPFQLGPTPRLPSTEWQATQPLDCASDCPAASAQPACRPAAGCGAAGRPSRARKWAAASAMPGTAAHPPPPRCRACWDGPRRTAARTAPHNGPALVGVNQKRGDHARHDVHAGAELRHEEVVQHVVRAQQHFHRPAERQVHFIVVYRGRCRGRPGRAGRGRTGWSR